MSDISHGANIAAAVQTIHEQRIAQLEATLAAREAVIERLCQAMVGYQNLTRRSQDALTTFLTPDGPGYERTVDQLLAILDGPIQRAVENEARAALAQARESMK